MKGRVKFLIQFTIVTLTLSSCSGEKEDPTTNVGARNKIETFTFSSNGVDIKGKIYLPGSFETNKNLPAIYLIDYQEQHFEVATDEFDKVISAVQYVENFDAIVVTLDDHPDIEAYPNAFQEYYAVFKDMASYVDEIYTNNTSRTFIGRASEAGIVLLTLLLENPETSVFDNFIATDSPNAFNIVVIDKLKNDDFPVNKLNKKLHFSFSSSNDQYQCTELINLIEEKQYSWLTFESKAYPNSIFENAYPVAYADGINFIFNQ